MANYIPLAAKELFKPGREGRAQVLVDKIEKGDPFQLLNGSLVIIKKDSNLISLLKKALKTQDKKIIDTAIFIDTKGKKYTIDKFAKSAEFGGKGSGASLSAESEALADLKKKLKTILKAENTPYIYVKVGIKTAKVAGLEKTEGVPKSDFHFLDDKGQEVIWMSHKKGNKANDFQQYGGMPELAPHPEMDEFVKAIKSKLKNPNELPMKTAFYRKVSNNSIKMKTLYGKQYKTGTPDSSQNIDVLFQGPINFVKGGKKGGITVYTLTANHVVLHGVCPTGDYAPYYYVRPEQLKNQFGIKGARFFIVAKLTAIKNRNATEV